jgi:hypothetical protein
MIDNWPRSLIEKLSNSLKIAVACLSKFEFCKALFGDTNHSDHQLISSSQFL